MLIKKYHIAVLLFIVGLFIPTHAQVDTIWSRTYGGARFDICYSVQQTSDGGYILAGFTSSFGAGGDDFWLIKTNAQGDSLWSKTFGGTRDDWCYSVQQTNDGGFILAGRTESFGAGSSDIWLIKTNAQGDSLWSKTFGGEKDDYCYSVQQTSDGGFILAGYTRSFGAGRGDFWLIKTNAQGDSLWSKTFGGEYSEYCYSVQQTNDGGFILAGYTSSFGAGSSDFWLIKTNAQGDSLWSKTFGGANFDDCRSVQQTSDGGFILAGYTSSFGAGSSDIWLIKTNAQGDSLWSKTFGGANYDYCYSVQQTSDGGFILAGYTSSFGAGLSDIWLIKTNAQGESLWSRTFGGAGMDICYSVQQTSDGGYILAGPTHSFGAGDYDFWLLRVGKSGNEFRMNISLTSGIRKDNSNIAAALRGCADTFDSGVDIPEPPVPLSDYLQLYFPHPEWGLPFTNFSTDMRAPADLLNENKVWDFIVATDQVNQVHTINITLQSGIDFTTPIYLKNLTNGDFVQLSAQQSSYSFTPTVAGNYPFQLIVGRLYPVQTINKQFPAGWNMFALPLSPLDKNIDALFRDDVNADGYFFRYNGNSGYGACDTLAVGGGYWLGLMNPATLRFTGDSLNSAVTMHLAYRNNLIGNPYKYRIGKGSLSFIKDGVTKTFAEATAAGWISGALHYWQNNGVGSYIATDTLGIWQGAWLYTLVDNVSLQFNPSPSGKSLTSSDTKLIGEEWEARLKLSASWGGDQASVIGVKTTATDGFDPGYDYPEPPTPPAGKYLTGYFEHSDWSVLGPRYDRDVRALGTTDWHWYYTVKSSLSGPVTISWELVNLPSNYTLILHDPVRNRDVNFREQNSYTFDYVGEITFDIRKESYTKVIQGQDNIPTEFSLAQNYPNPFNPVTTIHYTIPKTTNVKVAIYDLDGRVVELLVDEEQQPGWYSVKWNAEPYSSGIYFYRLQAGDFIETKKCLLIK